MAQGSTQEPWVTLLSSTTQVLLDVSSLRLTFSSSDREPATKAHIKRHQRVVQRLLSHRLGVWDRPVLATETRLPCSCSHACYNVSLHLPLPLSIQDPCPLSLVPLLPVPLEAPESSATDAASLTISAAPLSDGGLCTTRASLPSGSPNPFSATPVAKTPCGQDSEHQAYAW